MPDQDTDTDTTEQTTIDPFRELNRYDDRHEDWRSDAVYAPPRRTVDAGWRKFHAARDCGSNNVVFVEESGTRMHTSEKYAYNLVCRDCGYRIEETEVLFVGGDWYSEYGWQTYGRPIESLRIPQERVLDLGPDPDQDALRHALNLGRIERTAGPAMGGPIQRGRWRACEACGHEVPIRFDDRCRMCYDGAWTDRMQDSVNAYERKVREWHNGSFVHRLPTALTPTEPTGVAGEGEILWRRHDAESTSKLVEVVQRLEDYDDGHMEYVLWDPTMTCRWQYRAEDLDECFWATGLYTDEPKAVMDDRVREVYQQVCDHSFSEVHDPETHAVVGEQCHHCRKRRQADGQGYWYTPTGTKYHTRECPVVTAPDTILTHVGTLADVPDDREPCGHCRRIAMQRRGE